MSFSASISELIERSGSPLVASAETWTRVPLTEVASILNGFPWKSTHFNDSAGTPIIRIRDVTSGKTETHYNGIIVEGYWVNDGDLIVGMDGDFNCRVWAGGRALLNQRVCKIIPNEEFFLQSFMARLLPGYLNLINDETHSITVKHLSSKTLADLPLPLPPVPEQRRIVAKIDSLSAKSGRARDHLDHIPRLVETYKQAVLAAAFRGDLTREWRQSHPVKEDAFAYLSKRQAEHITRQGERGRGRDERAAQISLDEELKDKLAELSEAEPLPSTWCWASLGLAFGIYVGATPSRKEPRFWNGTVPWVSSGEVAFCTIRHTAERITELGLKETSTRLHPQGTLLIGMIGEGKTRGQVAILEVEAANNQNCAAIRVSEAGYNDDYVYWHLWKSYALTRTVGSGNNQQALNKERVQRIALPLAPPEEADEIARQIAQLSDWIDRLAKEATSARKLVARLDQAVLAKAFRGELVPQDPDDEPASALLERIRVERRSSATVTRGRRARAS